MADITDIITLAPHLKIVVRQATAQGYLVCPERGVFDAAYPSSKLRRARVQDGGMTCGTIACNPNFYTWFVYET